MKYVTLPIVGSLCVAIEDEDAEGLAHTDIIDMAIEMAYSNTEITSKDPTEVGEWEILHHVVQGNVFYGSCREAEIEDER